MHLLESKFGATGPATGILPDGAVVGESGQGPILWFGYERSTAAQLR